MEIWKKIAGYANYSVSNKGRVRNDKTGKIRSLVLGTNGYYQVQLFNPTRKLHYLHRLIAEAFIPNPNNYPCVNHIDENKTNNSIENLEWCTYQHNLTHGTRIERCREILRTRMLGKKHHVIKMLVDGVEYESMIAAAIACQCNVRTLRRYLDKGCDAYNGHKISLASTSSD